MNNNRITIIIVGLTFFVTIDELLAIYGAP